MPVVVRGVMEVCLLGIRLLLTVPLFLLLALFDVEGREDGRGFFLVFQLFHVKHPVFEIGLLNLHLTHFVLDIVL